MRDLPECIFCQIANGAAQSWKVQETPSALAFLDINPVAEYHTLVIPKRHYPNILEIPGDELTNVMETVKSVVDLFREKVGVQNLQLVHSSGRAAQQDVMHLHIHIVPRRGGDGQNITWNARPELSRCFPRMLERLL